MNTRRTHKNQPITSKSRRPRNKDDTSKQKTSKKFPAINNNVKNSIHNSKHQNESKKSIATSNNLRGKHDLSFFDKDDLFSKLNVLAKTKESFNKLNTSENDPREADDLPNTEANPTNFLKKKIIQIKEKRTKKIDYDRLLNPKHVKKASNLKNECTFQPMLSKKSLDLASKLGDAKSRLYSKKSINYNSKIGLEDESQKFQPKINQRSKFLDQRKGSQKMKRFEKLNKMVSSILTLGRKIYCKTPNENEK